MTRMTPLTHLRHNTVLAHITGTPKIPPRALALRILHDPRSVRVRVDALGQCPTRDEVHIEPCLVEHTLNLTRSPVRAR